MLESQEKAPMDEKLVVVVHTDNEAGANELADMVEAKWGVRRRSSSWPVIGAHVGPVGILRLVERQDEKGADGLLSPARRFWRRLTVLRLFYDLPA
ncbi:MAG: hypothetical protein ACLS4Z_01845 [Christensenellaceae bacterium]